MAATSTDEAVAEAPKLSDEINKLRRVSPGRRMKHKKTIRRVVRTTAGVIAFLLITLWVTQWATSPSTPKPQAGTTAPAGQQQTSNPCNGNVVHVTFTTAKMRLNPGGKCSLGIAHKGHCVYVWQGGKLQDKDKKKICWLGPTPDEQPQDGEWVAAVDQPFDGAYRLLPPIYTSTFRKP